MLKRSALYMDTVVGITVAAPQSPAAEAAIHRAFQHFAQVEQVCSRFDAASELSQLSLQVGWPVRVSPLLFGAVQFACEMAGFTSGVFDPTVGGMLERFGFDRDYRSGQRRDSGIDPSLAASYRDVLLDPEARTILLQKPLLLDLGAVAKGLAVDLAARELAPLGGFTIDAGGDVYAAGLNADGEPWRIGIQHPLRPDELIWSFSLTDAAVCTSGGYERPSPVARGAHHLVDPRSGSSPTDLLSCTVVAPFAMLADAASTAAFLLGPEQGSAYLDAAGLGGLFIDSSLHLQLTEKMARNT